MKAENEMRLVFPAKSINESFARTAAAVFAALLDPTVEELSDLKTAVSEAVTNAIVHGYRDTVGDVFLQMAVLPGRRLRIRVRDKGVGIADIAKAREPLFTTGGEERAGLGFAVMESCMDRVRVRSRVGGGTTVTLEKQISGK
ncbi:MAG: anti-sigma F factor [Clostridia bacterium]|nr:anti-sigma F factor [Clostridia bacterium]